MRIKLIIIVLNLVLTCFLYGESGYTFCIDGGGSKTTLQVIDRDGTIIPLNKNGIRSDRVETGGSNINIVGIKGVRMALRSLFENVKIDETYLVELICESSIVAGMSGLSLPSNQQAVISLLKEWGASPDRMHVMSDADLVLQLIEGDGMILIAGTGSICFGKKDGTLFRVGGLGKVLGDEGSGYQIGLQALQAVLAEEYGWGDPTSLTQTLKEFYGVPTLKNLIPHINCGEMLPSQIASCAPLVFVKAAENDQIAQDIIDNIAKELGMLLIKMLNIAHLSNCEVYLWGGVFKSPYADAFIEKILAYIPQANVTLVNKSHANAAVLFAFNTL